VFDYISPIFCDFIQHNGGISPESHNKTSYLVFSSIISLEETRILVSSAKRILVSSAKRMI
jgi:hypothetical protein